MKQVELYTDGACSGNPGKGGWGALLKFGEVTKELSGYAPDTTNNRMELSAVIEGLKALNQPCEVTVFSDSQYVVNTLNKGWKKNKNKDLWEDLDNVMAQHKVKFVWIKGHNGHTENEICDRLAVGEIVNAGGAG
ncbi:MAG: ribonuclease HI [Oscillospiraceae bacterium]|jgi:ribonuclease HI|nr:ribonuclease HI [Oscillospiraceae bacterium]